MFFIFYIFYNKKTSANWFADVFLIYFILLNVFADIFLICFASANVFADSF